MRAISKGERRRDELRDLLLNELFIPLAQFHPQQVIATQLADAILAHGIAWDVEAAAKRLQEMAVTDEDQVPAPWAAIQEWERKGYIERARAILAAAIRGKR